MVFDRIQTKLYPANNIDYRLLSIRFMRFTTENNYGGVYRHESVSWNQKLIHRAIAAGELKSRTWDSRYSLIPLPRRKGSQRPTDLECYRLSLGKMHQGTHYVLCAVFCCTYQPSNVEYVLILNGTDLPYLS